MENERRRAPRIHCTAWVHVTVEGESVAKVGRVADMSRVGLGIQFREAIEPGRMVRLSLKLLEDARTTVTWETSGRIVRCAKGENGFFLGVDLAEPITAENAPEMDAALKRVGG